MVQSAHSASSTCGTDEVGSSSHVSVCTVCFVATLRACGLTMRAALRVSTVRSSTSG